MKRILSTVFVDSQNIVKGEVLNERKSNFNGRNKFKDGIRF